MVDIIKVMDPRPLLILIVLLGSAGVISILLLTDEAPCSSTDQDKEARVTSGKSLPEEARLGESLETGANDKIKISVNASLQTREVALPLTTAEVGETDRPCTEDRLKEHLLVCICVSLH